MGWSDVGGEVAKYAPLLGTALGGPAGGAIGALVAKAFGVSEDPDAVLSAVKADPLAAVKLAQVEADTMRVKGDTLQAMLNAERTSQHTTRPKIALGSFRILAFCSIAVVSVFTYAVIAGDEAMVAAVVNGWPFVAAIVGPFVGLLYAYFGILRKESKDRVDALNGGSTGIVAGLLSKFTSR